MAVGYCGDHAGGGERIGGIIELTELQGMTWAAAECLGLSLPGAKSRVQRGRARLRAMLLRCCETDRRGRVIAFETRDGKGCASWGDEQRGLIKVAFGRPHQGPLAYRP